MDAPLTSICVIKDKRSIPKNFDCITIAYDGSDANLWKGGYFSKSSRYVCTSTSKSESSYGNIITNLQLISGSESVPRGFQVIAQTADTKEPAFQDNIRLIYKSLPLVSTSSCVTDIVFFPKRDARPAQYSTLGFINGFQFGVKNEASRKFLNAEKPDDSFPDQGLKTVRNSQKDNFKAITRSDSDRMQKCSSPYKVRNSVIFLSPLDGISWKLHKWTNFKKKLKLQL